MPFTIQYGKSKPVTLGDDLNSTNDGWWSVEITSWGGRCEVQSELLCQNPGSPFNAARGNVQGVFGFTATKSFSDIPAAVLDFASKQLLLGTQDVLILKVGGKIWTYTDACPKSIVRDPSRSSGVRMVIAYEFQLGALTVT